MYSTNYYPILRVEASGYGFKSLIQLRALFQPVEQKVSRDEILYETVASPLFFFLLIVF